MIIAVVLNWNDSVSTTRCVDSLLKFTCTDMIVIVDNCSDDNSKVIFREKYKYENKVETVENSVNSGYAGGNNFGIQYCLEKYYFDAIWVVNNDSYVEADALTPMVDLLIERPNNFVGSVIVNSDSETLECFGGGVCYPLLGKTRLFMKGKSIGDALSVTSMPDYVMGCSMLVPKQLLKDVGLMDEVYFMYSEEVDWQKRSQEYGYGILVSKDSIVYHDGSGSTGGKSPAYHYYRNRASIIFNRKFFNIGTTVLSVFFLTIVFVFQEFRRPKNIIRGLVGIRDGLGIEIGRLK